MVADLINLPLKLTVYDKDKGKLDRDDLLGSCQVNPIHICIDR